MQEPCGLFLLVTHAFLLLCPVVLGGQSHVWFSHHCVISTGRCTLRKMLDSCWSGESWTPCVSSAFAEMQIHLSEMVTKAVGSFPGHSFLKTELLIDFVNFPRVQQPRCLVCFTSLLIWPLTCKTNVAYWANEHLQKRSEQMRPVSWRQLGSFTQL